jgi:small subunit ribosomal protein S1
MTDPTSPEGADVAATDLDLQLQREIDDALGDQTIEQLLEASTGPADAPAVKGNPDRKPDEPAEVGFDLKRGKISAIQGEDVFVNLQGEDAKLQGVVPLRQFDRSPRVGSIMDFVVERTDESEGLVHLSREGAVTSATWQQLDRGSVVEARVASTNKGGLELEMAGGIRAFMPASQVDMRHVDDLEPLVGQKVKAMVQELDRRGRKVVLSRRRFLEHERQSQRQKLLEELEVGQTRTGTVTNIVQFGAFVDLGGLDGMVHISDMSYGRIDKPSDAVKTGQEVTVKVLKIDTEQQRIRLGLKQVGPDPWESIEVRVHAGDEVSGRVLRLTDFGAFVEVEPGVEGLLPLSEMSWKRIHNPSQAVNEQETIRLKVLQIDAEKKRLSLSLKQAQGDPWSGVESRYPPDAMVDATVLRTTTYGAFVELEPGVEGLAHVSQLTDKRVNDASEVVEVGQKKQFRVLEVDIAERRIRLSLKPAGSETAGAQGASERPAAAEMAPKKTAGRRRPSGPLKGGIGQGGGMGTGLRDLKL